MAPSKCPGCGAALPEGANFCPGCGRALGAVERPRTPADGGGWTEFIDKAWDFFASTKVAAALIALLAVASILGSLVEQEHLYQDWRPPYMYYPDRYGPFWGNLYMRLGLTHAYSSAWYAGLILLVVISLIICSLHRVVPLYRTLSNPQVYKLPHFITRQQVTGETEGTLDEMAAQLQKRGYKIRRDRESLYGDKGRLSRYGPYIIHIGLLIVAFAGISRAIPGWNETRDVWIPDGQTAKVPDTNFAITNHTFTMELYASGMPARFATEASIIQDGQEVLQRTIEVNKPLHYQGWDIYQASWREEPGIAHLQVIVPGQPQPVTTLAFDLRQPEEAYPITDTIKLVVRSYFHDLQVDEKTGVPTNASFEVRNPAILGEFVDEKGQVIGRVALTVLGESKAAFQGPYTLQIEKVETRWFTALKLHKDKSVPFMFAGLTVVMLGMMITFFLFHWQVWVREEQGKLLVGARAYKNKFGLRREIERLLGRPI